MTFSLLLTCFILIIPIFGKAINYGESFVLYGGIVVISLFAFFYHPPRYLTKKFFIFETTLILLSLFSTIFSQNIGYSYYGLFNFIFSLVALNLCLTYLDTEKLSKYILYFSLFYSTIFLLNKFNFITIALDPSFDNFILQVWGHSYLADFLIFSIPYLLYQLFYSSTLSTSKKYFYYFCLFFVLTTTIFTNSRSAIVSLTLSSFFIFLPKIPKHLRIFFMLLMISLATFISYQIFSQNRNLKSLDGNRFEYWQQATKAFIDRPLLGHGPFNFFYINKKYETTLISNTNYAHNSLLEYLCLNGLPFTLIIFTAIFFSLLYQYRRYPLNFVLSLAALTNSFFDPSWNSLGIFCLSLFFIFNKNPHVVLPSTSKTKKNSPFPLILLIFTSLFFLSKTSSDYLFISNQPTLSLYADPFNLNARLALLPSYTHSTLVLYQHDFHLYQQLIKTIPLPQSEIYYYKSIEIDSKKNIRNYSQLAAYYLSSNNFEKLNQLLSQANQNLNPLNFTISDSLSLAKISYNFAVIEWQNQLYPSALRHFQIAVNFSYGWSQFQIELANAYWHYNQKDLALKQLTIECQKFSDSIKNCQEYLSQHSQSFLEPGTQGFQDSINSLP